MPLIRRPAIKIMLCVLLTSAPSSYAGGIINKQIFSTAYGGALSRNSASGSLDTTVYNPGAVTTLPVGTTVGMDMAWLDKKYSNQINGQEYVSDVSSVVPGLFAALRKDDWAVFAAIIVPGGGGSVDYSQGEVVSLSIGNALLNTVGPPYTAVGLGNLEATSFAISYRLGLAKQLGDQVSVAAGFRYVDAVKEVTGSGSITGPDPLPAIRTDLGYDQNAAGSGYFLGGSYTATPNLSFGFRYESRVKLNYETDITQTTQNSGNPALDSFPVAVLAANQAVQGEKLREDLPTLVGAGIRYRLSPNWYSTASYTLYLEKDARWDARSHPDKNAYDVALSLGWNVLPDLTAEMGLMQTNTSLPTDEMLSLSPELNSLTTGIHLRWQANKTTVLNISTTIVNFDSATTSQGVGYTKKIFGLSAGLEYRF